ncbi:hypothetical protein JOC85_001072 [Bacillus mesophilus]|uniref:Uncharacterized protein n=1 Tax=Bacillus mesophilus TaxID=1808955 RepID=A0A6M0Q7D0_9BACI|nr:hypothetical protein [Bacillus mesophilus]MBM7660305.1 hypothetical protein [Bacillus mesophilus]NEY71018.1 hypothetical protein [Bacillus mesophilus]
MSTIKGLLWKDYRLSRVHIFSMFVGIMLIMIAGFGYSAYMMQPVGTLPVYIFLSLFMFVYAPITMLTLLNIESKNQLWLYSPRKGSTLLLSKYAVIFSSQLFIQLILLVYAAISLYFFGKNHYEQMSIGVFIQSISMINLIMVIFAVYFTSWVTLYWSIYHSLKHLPKLKPFRWLIILALFIVFNLIETWIQEIPFIDHLIYLVEVQVFINAEFSFGQEDWFVTFSETAIPIIPLIYYVLLTILLFTIAARLLERKVEV